MDMGSSVKTADLSVVAPDSHKGIPHHPASALSGFWVVNHKETGGRWFFPAMVLGWSATTVPAGLATSYLMMVSTILLTWAETLPACVARVVPGRTPGPVTALRWFETPELAMGWWRPADQAGTPGYILPGHHRRDYDPAMVGP